MKRSFFKILRTIHNDFLYLKKKNSCGKTTNDTSHLFDSAKEFFAETNHISYCYKLISLPQDTNQNYKWVGSCSSEKKVFFFPNDADCFLLLSDYDEVKYIGSLSKGSFKWTGGCIWNNKVFAFPRKKTSFAILDMQDFHVFETELASNYMREHHYGGVLVGNGVIYQPPRDSDHILVTDLNTMRIRKIQIAPAFCRRHFRYCGSVIHPNGYIYFLPESNNRVIKLNPETNDFEFIGSRITPMVFDAKVGIDGNIYGFSAYQRGLLKIDTENETVEMIHSEINAGAYGTKYGVNGKLYSIPGNGQNVWEFDPVTDTCRLVFNLNDSSEAKYAGGTVMNNGMIVCTPANANNILVMIPEQKTRIPNSVYTSFFFDCY